MNSTSENKNPGITNSGELYAALHDDTGRNTVIIAETEDDWQALTTAGVPVLLCKDQKITGQLYSMLQNKPTRKTIIICNALDQNIATGWRETIRQIERDTSAIIKTVPAGIRKTMEELRNNPGSDHSKKWKKAILAYAEHEEEQATATIRNLEEQKKQVQKKIDNILRALESGVWSDSVNERLHALEQQIETIEQRIETEKLSQVQFTADDIKRFLHALRNAEKTDSESQQYLINSCINRIYLFDDDDGQRMVIHVNMSDQQTEPVTRECVVRIMSESLHFTNIKRTLADTGDVLLSVSMA